MAKKTPVTENTHFTDLLEQKDPQLASIYKSLGKQARLEQLCAQTMENQRLIEVEEDIVVELFCKDTVEYSNDEEILEHIKRTAGVPNYRKTSSLPANIVLFVLSFMLVYVSAIFITGTPRMYEWSTVGRGLYVVCSMGLFLGLLLNKSNK